MFDKIAYYRVWRAKNPEKSRAYSAKWKANNPDKVTASQARQDARKTPHDHRYSNVRRLYGLTRAQYDALLGKQNGLCALCGMTNDGRSLCVDHEHVDGYDDLPPNKKAALVRGLLCSGCNTLIGYSYDEPETISRKARALSNIETYLRN